MTIVYKYMSIKMYTTPIHCLLFLYQTYGMEHHMYNLYKHDKLYNPEYIISDKFLYTYIQ